MGAVHPRNKTNNTESITKVMKGEEKIMTETDKDDLIDELLPKLKKYYEGRIKYDKQ